LRAGYEILKNIVLVESRILVMKCCLLMLNLQNTILQVSVGTVY